MIDSEASDLLRVTWVALSPFITFPGLREGRILCPGDEASLQSTCKTATPPQDGICIPILAECCSLGNGYQRVIGTSEYLIGHTPSYTHYVYTDHKYSYRLPTPFLTWFAESIIYTQLEYLCNHGSWRGSLLSHDHVLIIVPSEDSCWWLGMGNTIS